MKQKDVEIRSFELALSILHNKPSDENRKIKEWATKVINKHTEVPINEAARVELANQAVPFPDRASPTIKGASDTQAAWVLRDIQATLVTVDRAMRQAEEELSKQR